MEENFIQNETQSDPNDLDLVNYHQKRAGNASNNSNSNNSNSQETFREDFEQNSNQIENQSIQYHHQSSNNNSHFLQSNSNQHFGQFSNFIIQQTNMDEDVDMNSTNPYIQPNDQPNPRETNSIERDQNIMSNTNPYLQPNDQPNVREGENIGQSSQASFQIDSEVHAQQIFSEERIVQTFLQTNIQNSQSDPLEGLNVEDSNAIRNEVPYLFTTTQITLNSQDSIDENVYKANPRELNSNPLQPISTLAPYVSATPKLLADIDNYPVESVVKGCGENVPWTDFFFHLVGKGEQSKYKQSEPKLEELISLFSKKAQEVGEELIDAYIDGNFDYLEKFRVDIGGIAGGRKYLKSNILFKFAIDDYKIYKDNRNSMKVASQELRVINHLVNEKSLNRLFVLPCLALITKCGLRMYASSLLPLNPKESLKYGCQDLRQLSRIVKKDDETMNNIFNLISQTLNLKNHSVSGDKNNMEILCADVEGHLGTDRNYYLVDTTRLFPPEAPFNTANKNNNDNSIKSTNNDSNEHFFTFLKPELVRTSSSPLNNDCFSVFWNGNENQRKEEEGNIQKLTDSLYSTLIPELSLSIQNGTIQIKNIDEVKRILHHKMICLRHLPYLIENILVDFSKLSNQARDSLNFLLVEMFSRILKWKWYSLRGNHLQKQSQTISTLKLYFLESNAKARISNWIQLLNQYISIRSARLKNENQFSQHCSLFLKDLFDKVSKRFCELSGIQVISMKEGCKFKSIVKSIDLPKSKSLGELIELKKEQELKFGKDSLILALTLLEIARFHNYLSKQPNYVESFRFYKEVLRIYAFHGKQNEFQTLSIQLEIIQIKDWSNESLEMSFSIKEKMEKTIGKQHPHFAATLYLLGVVLFNQRKYEESLKYYEECLKIREQTIGKQHPKYAETLNDIGIIFQKQGKFEESLKYFEECLKIEEQTIGKQHPDYATPLHNIGSNLSKQGKFEESLKYYEECLKIREQTIGKQHPNYAITLNDIANVLQKQRKFEESLKYYKECLKIYEQTIGKQHPGYATTLNNIGSNLNSQRKFEESLKYFEECLKIQQQTIGKQHPHYATTLGWIGDSFQKQGKFEESLKYFNECLKIQHSATILYNIGIIFQHQDKYEESLKYLEECLKIQEQTIGKQNAKYATTLWNIGNVLKNQDKFEESLKCFEECLKIQEQTIGKQHRNYARTLNDIGSNLSKQGKFETAFKYVEESLKIQEKTIGKQHPNYAIILNDIGTVFIDQGKFESALDQN